ncbi:MAG: NADH-quinone oxidoreductase subunit M [Verrucomicrobiota bacterium]
MTLLLLLLIPLAAIFLIMLRCPAKPVAVWGAAANFVYSIVMMGGYDTTGSAGSKIIDGYQFVIKYPWLDLPGLPLISFHLGLDGINAPLVFLCTTVTLAAVSLTPATIKRAPEFFIYVLLMSLGALGAFLSLDLFFFFIFHEFALIPTFLLIGIWGTQNRQFASMQLTLYLTLGSLVLLGGILALVLWSGANTFDIVDIQKQLANTALSETDQFAIWPLLLVGFGILISLFPFHTWAPGGYACAPPAAAMMHAGVLKKFGIYGILRVAMPCLDPSGAAWAYWEPWLWVLLLGNVLFVGYTTVAQKELPLMLGFSSVMHMGYMFLGIATFDLIGLTGVVMLMVAHGLSAALLFAIAGEIQQRTGENRMDQLGGLAKRMPFLATAFVLGSLASVGMPGLANFAGEIMIFFGAFNRINFGAYEAGQAVPLMIVVILAIWGIVISAIYSLRSISKVFFGDLPERYAEVRDLETFQERAPYILLMAVLLLLGFVPSIITSNAHQSLSLMLGGGS